MSEVTTIAAELRDRAGKGAARATRRTGKVPGVIYGAKQTPVCIALDPRVLWAEMHKSGFFTQLFDVDLGKDGKHRCLARDVQMQPVTDQPIHVDFMRVSADARVHVQVPVHFVNDTKSPGLKRGGVLNVVRHEIDLVCSPENIPHEISIDLTGLDIGDSVHISAVQLPEGAKPTIDRDFTIASIAAPTVRAEGGDEAAG
jgi:large subunit ribosomal protein L25